MSVNRAILVLMLLVASLGLRVGSSLSIPSVYAGRSRHTFPVPNCDAASYGPTHHDYPATDIFVVRGTRFLAVTSGIVEQ